MGEKFNIEKQILENAKIIASKINNKEARKRAYALAIGASCTAEYLSNSGIDIKTKLSLFKVASFAQNLELADIYAGDARLDVRVTFNDKTFSIPKTHEKYCAIPDAYIVIKLDTSLNEAEILGFTDSNSLEYPESNNEYYLFSTDILKPISELRIFLSSIKLKMMPFSSEENEKIKELSAAFIDDEISESEKVYFIKHVVACAACRESFCELNEFDTIVSQMKNHTDLLNDSTLSVLTGNKKEIDSAIISEQENIQENEPEEIAFIEEETIDEIAPETKESIEITQEIPVESVETILSANADANFDLNTVELQEEQEELTLEEQIEELPAIDEIKEMEYISETEQSIADENESEITEQTEQEITLIETIKDEETGLLNESAEETVEEIVADNDEENAQLEIKEANESEIEEEQILEEHTELMQLDDSEEPMLIQEDNEEMLIEETPIDKPLEISEESETIEETKNELKEEILDIDNEEKTEEIEEIHPEEPKEASGLEIEDLETLDSLEEMDALGEIEELHMDELENITEEPQNIEEKPSAHNDFSLIEENEENDESQKNEEETLTLQTEDEETFETPVEGIKVEENNETIASFTQEPIELNYDDEEVEEMTRVEEIHEENSYYDSSLQEQHQYLDAQEQEEAPQSTQPQVDEEIQGLLDDDLLALLSDSDDDQTETTNATPAYTNSQTETAYEDNIHQDTIDFGDEEQETQENYESDTPQENADENIETLFDNNDENAAEEGEENNIIDINKEPVSEATANAAKKIIIGSALLLLLAGGAGAAWFMNHNKTADTNTDMLDTANQSDSLFDFENKGKSDDSETPAVSQDINKSMANSFSDKPAAITITKISWQVSEKLASEASVKEYLQTAGKNIQMNLQNDLANSADITFNPSIKVSFEIAPDNTLKGMQVLESSGSDKIDETVLRSIKNTLKYVSVPKLKDFKSDYFLTIVINF